MTVATKTNQGRRTLAFASFDDILADAERLVASPRTRMLGNWPLDRLLTHLATAIHASIDGIRFRVPWYIRLVGFFIKRYVLNRRMPSGFRLPTKGEADAFPRAIKTIVRMRPGP